MKKSHFKRNNCLLLILLLPTICLPGQGGAGDHFVRLSQAKVTEIYQHLTKDQTDLPVIITMPVANGKEIRFRASKNEVIPGPLQATYPSISSYNLVGVDRPELIGKMMVTPDKILGNIISPNGWLTLSSVQAVPTDTLRPVSSQLAESDLEGQPLACGLDELKPLRFKQEIAKLRSRESWTARGDVLKNFRMAIAVTGEFYQANGNNDSDVLLAITYSLNAINLIFENDLSITFVLASDPILFNDPQMDPFIPDNEGGGFRADQARHVIDSLFAANAYDFGHVLHTNSPGDGWSGGGEAYVGVVCNSFSDGTGRYKGGGWSGAPNNVFNGWIQLFAHEVGHMYGARHTFNGIGGSCNSNNIGTSSAIEIGSGTTIMSYNGLCQLDNNIPGRGVADNYFHYFSLHEMYHYTEIDPVGSSCGTSVATNNAVPQVDANPNQDRLYIPVSTPFELEGVAIDNDSENLSYNWEQIDEDGAGVTPTQGFIGNTAANSTLAPLFRSFPPDDNPRRLFPGLENILQGNNTGQPFEALPAVSRSIDFSFTVRDNQSGVNAEQITVFVEDNGGAFEITAPNSPLSLNHDGTNTFQVLWNVAGTTGGNIKCELVDIYFSANGGASFPYLLAEGVPNDGAETITVPNIATANGRIKVKGKGNIFFDINNADLSITSDCMVESVTFSPDTDLLEERGAPALNLTLSPDYGSPVAGYAGVVENSDPISNLAILTDGNCQAYTNNTYNDIYPFEVDQIGTYTFQSVSNEGEGINIYETSFNPDDPCANLIATNYYVTDGFLFTNSEVSIALDRGKSYVLVVNGVFSLPITYQIDYQGPGVLYDQNPPPGPGFSNSYIISDASTGRIIRFEDDPDLSDPNQFSAGYYQIQGLTFDNQSVSTQSLNANFTGLTLEELNRAILFDGLCIALSDNTKSVTILFPNAAIALVKTGVFNDENRDGMAQVGESIGYTFAVSNLGNVPLTGIEISDPKVNVMGGPLNSLAPGEQNLSSFSASYSLLQADIDAGSVSNQAMAMGLDPNSNQITDLSDDTSPQENDPTLILLSNCIQIETFLYLEGSTITSGSDDYRLPMRTTLNDLGLLPGQVYSNLLGGDSYTESGQPYGQAPWNYFGTEGDQYDSGGDANFSKAGYPSTVVDWVLVSLRSDPEGSTGPICQAAALLHQDGRVEFIPGFACCQINPTETYYLVIEHRNHLITMSPDPLPIVNDTLRFDFRTSQGYINDPFDLNAFAGQREMLLNGQSVYMLFGANGDQTSSNSSDTDINLGDLIYWERENGEFGHYKIGDFNLNGDINFNDRILFDFNNSKFTSVPRN